MAKFSLEFPVDMFEGLKGKLDDVATEMIDEAMPIYEKSFKNALEKHRDTGQLIQSIRSNKASETNGVYSASLTAAGNAKGKKYKRKRKSGKTKDEPFRNYQKILAIEYGNLHGETPKPFMERTALECHDNVVDKMQQVFNERVK